MTLLGDDLLIAGANQLLLVSGADERHSRQVAQLAIQLASQLKNQLGLEAADLPLLEAAARIHDIGVPLSESAHNKVARDLILAADWPGLSERQRLLLANLARYHRKSEPALTHKLYADLSPDDQQRVRALAALLRLADGLDRPHNAAVEQLEVSFPVPGQCVITASGKSSLAYNLMGGELKQGLLEQVLNVTISLHPAS